MQKLANKNQQKYIKFFSLIGIFGMLIVSIYNSAFKNGKFTCNRYILNSYLYILLVLVLMMLEILYLDTEGVEVMDIYKYIPGITGLLVGLMLLISILYILMKIPPKNVFIKHTVWIIFSLMLGILAYPAYMKSKNENTLVSVMFSLIAILVVFSAVAFIKPEWISLSWGPVLFFVLLGVIILQLIKLFFYKEVGNPKALSYFIIVLFIFFLLYDTKLIQINAKRCKTATADYINESLGIILDILNLFQNLVMVQN